MSDAQIQGQMDGSGVQRPKVCPYRTVGNYAIASTAGAAMIVAGTGVLVTGITAGQKVQIIGVHLIHDEAANDFVELLDGTPATGTLIWKKDIAPQTAYNENVVLKLCTSTDGVWLDVETDWEDAGEKCAAVDYRKWSQRTV